MALHRDPTFVVDDPGPTGESAPAAIKEDGSVASTKGGVAFVASFEPAVAKTPVPRYDPAVCLFCLQPTAAGGEGGGGGLTRHLDNTCHCVLSPRTQTSLTRSRTLQRTEAESSIPSPPLLRRQSTFTLGDEASLPTEDGFVVPSADDKPVARDPAIPPVRSQELEAGGHGIVAPRVDDSPSTSDALADASVITAPQPGAAARSKQPRRSWREVLEEERATGPTASTPNKAKSAAKRRTKKRVQPSARSQLRVVLSIRDSWSEWSDGAKEVGLTEVEFFDAQGNKMELLPSEVTVDGEKSLSAGRLVNGKALTVRKSLPPLPPAYCTVV